MSLDKIFVIALSATGIAFTYWFFLLKRDKEVGVSGSVDIVVEGGYSPSTISIIKGKPTTLNFLRKDPSSCLEEVVIPDFKIRKQLPINKKTSVTITPKESGTFEISCGMNMFHGKIIVR